MNSSEKIVCIDLFDTIVRSSREGPSYEDILRELGVDPKEIYPVVRDRIMIQDRTYPDMVGRLFKYFGQGSVNKGLKKRAAKLWESSNEEVDWLPEAKNILTALREELGARLVLVSNVTGPAWRKINKDLSVDDFFDSTFLSFKEGISKPNSAVWWRIQNRMEREYEYWMVGNSVSDDLVVPARLGWKTFQVREGGRNLGQLVESIRNGISADLCTIMEEMSYELKPQKVMLVDVPMDEGAKSNLEQFNLEVIDASDMTREILGWEGWSKFDPSSTVLIFPGNGAQILKEKLPAEWLRQWSEIIDIDIRRLWEPGNDPVVVGGRMFPERMLVDVKDVVILDDVVSSGLTVRQIVKRNSVWFPQADWSIVSWVAQRSANVKDFKTFFAPQLAGTVASKAPINSLSTIMEDESVASSYAKRNFKGRCKEFLDFIGSMRMNRANTSFNQSQNE